MVKPQRYNSLGGRQAYKPYSLYEDEKLDTKLYTKEEVADQMAYFSTECSIGGDEAPHSLFESSSSRTRFRGDDHNDGVRFEGRIEDEGKQEGNSLVHHHSSSLPSSSSSDSLSVIEFGMDSQPASYFKPPRKVDNVAPRRGKYLRRVFQRNNHADNHHHGDDQQEFEEGRKALNFDFTPKPRLAESKRVALKAFYDKVQQIESNLKTPLQIYLKENEGNGFIGKFTNGNDSFRSKHKEEYAPPSRFNSMIDHDPYHAENAMMMMKRERRFCNPFISDSISCVPSNIRYANRRMEEMNRMEEQRYFFAQERRRMGRRMEKYYGMQYSLSPSPPPQDDSPLILEDAQDDSSPLLIDMSTMCDEEDRDFNFQDGH